MPISKLFKYFSFVFLLNIPLGAAFAESALQDRIIAIVNNKPILLSEIQEKTKRGPLVKISAYPSDDSSSDFDKALNDAINGRLVLEKAKELDIEVSDEQAEKQIDDMLRENNNNRAGLLDFLQKNGKKYDDYKNDIKEQMIFMRFKGRVILPLVKTTDRDLESFYLSKNGSSLDALELSLRQIFIKTPEGMDSSLLASKEKLIEEVEAKLKSGVEFKEAEKIYSDNPDARDGIQARIFKLKDFNSQIRKELEKLQVGEYTAPIKTPVGFYLFFLESKRLTGSQEFQQQKKALEAELRMQETQRQLNLWIKNAAQKAKIKQIKE